MGKFLIAEIVQETCWHHALGDRLSFAYIGLSDGDVMRRRRELDRVLILLTHHSGHQSSVPEREERHGLVFRHHGTGMDDVLNQVIDRVPAASREIRSQRAPASKQDVTASASLIEKGLSLTWDAAGEEGGSELPL